MKSISYLGKLHSCSWTGKKKERKKKRNRTNQHKDRYDARHLLDELVEVTEKAKLEKEYDSERYAMEEKTDLEKNNVGGTAIAYDYNDEYKKHKRVVTEIENEIMKKYNTPKEMIVVKSQL